MERNREASVARVPGSAAIGNVHICALPGCGEQAAIVAGHHALHCEPHRRQLQDEKKGRAPAHEGPAPEEALDIAIIRAGKRIGTVPCAYDDCGQPAMRGRLYCSSVCRVRARKTPPLFEIEGVRATLREHADARGIDISTVYCRMRHGYSPVEAITTEVDSLQRWRRAGGIDAHP